MVVSSPPPPSQEQPKHHSPNTWNRTEYRGMEGFVAAVTPFNFTAIGTNLSMTPTLMGNVSLFFCIFKILYTCTSPTFCLGVCLEAIQHGHSL